MFMFCPDCGTKLLDSNQKFCQNCGGKTILTKEVSPPISPYIQQSSLQSKPVATKVLVKYEGKASSHSIKCLIYALVSIGIVAFGLIFNFGARTYVIFQSSGFFFFIGGGSGADIDKFIGILIIISIITILIHILGLMFGFLSRAHSRKAEGGSEPINAVEQVGSIFAIIGIIGNIIAIIIAIVTLVILF